MLRTIPRLISRDLTTLRLKFINGVNDNSDLYLRSDDNVKNEDLAILETS
jgi:hypothetical protein